MGNATLHIRATTTYPQKTKDNRDTQRNLHKMLGGPRHEKEHRTGYQNGVGTREHGNVNQIVVEKGNFRRFVVVTNRIVVVGQQRTPAIRKRPRSKRGVEHHNAHEVKDKEQQEHHVATGELLLGTLGFLHVQLRGLLALVHLAGAFLASKGRATALRSNGGRRIRFSVRGGRDALR